MHKETGQPVTDQDETGQGVSLDALPVLTPPRIRQRTPRTSPEIGKSSWLGLVNSIMARSTMQVQVLMDSVEFIKDWMKEQQVSQQKFMESMLMKQSAVSATATSTEDPLGGVDGNPVVTQPGSSVLSDAMFQRQSETHTVGGGMPTVGR